MSRSAANDTNRNSPKNHFRAGVSKKSSIPQTSPVWMTSISPGEFLELFNSENGKKDVIEWLIYLKSNKHACEYLALNSVADNNGFVKIRLAHRGQDEPDLRLHVWREDQKSPSDFHNHPWDFVTLGLRGCIEHKIYNRDEGKGFDVYRYETSSPVDVKVRKVGTSNLKPTLIAEAFRGTILKYSRELIHQVQKKGDSMAMSIVARQKFCEPSLVFRPQGSPEPGPHPPNRLRAEIVTRYLSSAVDALETLM